MRRFVRPSARWANDEDGSPLTRARGVARRLWQQFDRALERKYTLVALLRTDRRLTPEDQHRIASILAEVNDYLAELDGQLDIAEAAVRRLIQAEPA